MFSFMKKGKMKSDDALIKRQKDDPYYVADLEEHKTDHGNILLGYESISFVGGHAFTDVVFYPALHQVITHNCAKYDGKSGYKSKVDRVLIPEHLFTKNEIIAYLKQNGFSPAHLLREEKYNCHDLNKISSLNPSFKKKAGVKWEINSNDWKTVQYVYFDGANSTTFGSEECDGPTILLDRDYYMYLSISFDLERDSYMVIEDFDGPLRFYPHGEIFTYGIESFTLL